jgi:asparagine synthase (glutamine-hydrolysing)
VEFLLCGYVLGRNTLFKNISSLQAGESLVVEKRSATLELNSHFQYFPSTPLPYPESTLIEMFGEVLDRAFRRVCSLAKGRPIWVPLSGGLDSRLILCKLIEHKYPHVSTFSYGINRNSDMTRAKQVAKALGVPWLHCPSRVQQLPTLYQSSIRKAYTDYAWGAHAVPVWMDFEAIAHLRRENIMTQDSVIVNGYSGDFLFGGHIPASLISEPTLETLVSSIISKHCSHFEQGVFDSQQSRIAEQIRRNFLYDHGNKTKDVEALCSFYESWDWRERQVKAVVNGQRLYDCCGLKWLLPLWDKELVDFWARIPLNQRAHQKLHIAYLKKYNFRGQFSTLRAPNKLWPLHLRWTPILGNVIQLFSSRKTKLGFYRFMFFFGVHRFQLGLFGCGFFAKHVHYLRHPYVVPIAAIKQLQDVRLELPSEISQNR